MAYQKFILDQGHIIGAKNSAHAEVHKPYEPEEHEEKKGLSFNVSIPFHGYQCNLNDTGIQRIIEKYGTSVV